MTKNTIHATATTKAGVNVENRRIDSNPITNTTGT